MGILEAGAVPGSRDRPHAREHDFDYVAEQTKLNTNPEIRGKGDGDQVCGRKTVPKCESLIT